MITIDRMDIIRSMVRRRCERYSRRRAALAIVGLSIAAWIACVAIAHGAHDLTARVLELVP